MGPVADSLRRAGAGPGSLVGLAVAPGVGAGFAFEGLTLTGSAATVESVESELAPRWVLWSNETAVALAGEGVRLAACWDVAAVHRLLSGGWRAEPARVWARSRGLAADTIPSQGPVDLFTVDDDDDGDDAVRSDGHLRPSDWATSPERLARWAEVAVEVADAQRAELAGVGDRALATARSESAAELLCAELSVDGLPLDRAAAEALLASVIGPRPRTDAEAALLRERRDGEVLRHAPPGTSADLRSPGQVKSLLRSIGVEVADTRAWRLEALRSTHPLVDALLVWRKAERVATTYGYAWLDEHVGDDGRLRGAWSGSDGAAGRMTASAGLHNMPADMRAAVVAAPGCVFVRADLGQIEPRVLAAVSGDAALARATLDDDLYAPVAAQLDVDRATAKVAVLGAMYGQTTGHGAQALWRLRAAYPVAMAYLDEADRAAQVGRDLRTYGGRLIRTGSADVASLSDRDARGRAAARGRYGRNALVQGAAAELFKAWAATVRARVAPLGGRIVLCLHDELLVHAPSSEGEAVADLVGACLQEAAGRWAPDRSVRFLADVAVLRRWSDAKP